MPEVSDGSRFSVHDCDFHTAIISRRPRQVLTELAVQLIAIAALRVPRLGRSRTEACLECSRKRFCGTKPDRQRDLQHRQARLRDKPQRRGFQPPAAHVIAERLAEPGREQAVKVEGREVRDSRQRIQLQLLVEPAVDVLEHSMHAGVVLRAAIPSRHRCLSHKAVGGESGLHHRRRAADSRRMPSSRMIRAVGASPQVRRLRNSSGGTSRRSRTSKRSTHGSSSTRAQNRDW